MQTVHCALFKEDKEALAKAPYPGPLGQKILKHVSKEAWGKWLSHQTILINEYRLTLHSVESRKFLEQEMEKFFFGSGSNKPKEYQAPSSP